MLGRRSLRVSERVLVFQFDQEKAQRLDHFLVTVIPEHSRSFLQNLIKEGLVTIDGEVAVKTGTKLDAQHSIEVRIPPPKPTDLIPEDIPLDIIYEDQDLMVVDKPPGLVVHPSAGHASGTLVQAVLAHAPDIEGVGGEKRPGLVHRLDKNTSGLIVLAKKDQVHRNLQAQFKARSVEKYYLALVDGHPQTPSGKVEAAIGRSPRDRKKMAVVPEKKGRMAVSLYKTLEAFDDHSLLEVQILTGRTHQIRVHLAFLKCPVVGDAVYGRRKASLPVPRFMLHAARLMFELPGGETRTFEAPLPEDFQRALDDLRASL
ncbi:RluA family pseudouridine synthase [Chloroflexota bacterium]